MSQHATVSSNVTSECTSISLANGIELVVRADADQSLVDAVKDLLDPVESKKTIEHTVDLLVKENSDESLDGLVCILAAVGWGSHRTAHGITEIAAAIRMLTPLADASALLSIREAAELAMHQSWARAEVAEAARS